MFPKSTTILQIVVLATAISAARGATVVTEDGRILVGAVTRSDAERGVTLKLLDGKTVTLDPDEIVRIDPRETPAERYARRRRGLEEGDADGHYRLGEWCMDHGLREEALFEWRMAIMHEPDHAEARKALGFRRDGDRWVDEETYLTERGYVYYKGRWIEKEIAEKRKARRREAEDRARWVQTVNRLVRQIESGDDEARSLAMGQFARLSDPAALESARRHLRNTDPNVRRAVIRLIYTNRLAAHYDDLLKSAVRDDSADVRREAAEALARVADREMLDDLIDHMRSTSDTVRRNAIVASLVVEDAEVFAELLKHIDDEDKTIRLAVIEGIRRTGFRKAAGDLQELALEDGDDDVRLAAARTLAEVHRPGDSLETLTAALDDRHESVRARAAEALTICGDPAAIPHLIQGLYITAPRPGGDRTPVIGDQRRLIDPVERSPLLGYRVNEAAQVALVEFAGVNFEYSKRKWSRWWKVNGKGLLEDYARRKAKKE